VSWNIIQHNNGYVTQLAGTEGRGQGSPVEWVGAFVIDCPPSCRLSSPSTSDAPISPSEGPSPEDRLDANIEGWRLGAGILQPVELVADYAAAGGAFFVYVGIVRHWLDRLLRCRDHPGSVSVGL
jgi:hypothetical protein